MRRRLGRAGTLAVAVAGLLAGCADGDSDDAAGPGGPPASIRSSDLDGQDGPEGDGEPVALDEVDSWLYLIDVDLSEETLRQIEASPHDLVVLDNIPSEENNTDFPMAEVVERLHDAEHPKLVVAYLDVGQAEDYRTYWEAGWGIGDPDWIVALDPDGWEGNYPVAYWDEAWREIWLEDGGMLDGVVEAGFDGMYLDWIEAYSDDNVLAAAERDDVDPREEMVAWIGDLADHARERNPEFVVIGQNALELVEDDAYVAIVDGVAQEQTWFDGAADNDPPGDCPLPATDDDIDTDAYVDSLSDGCRAQWEEFPDSTLHVSTEEYLGWLEEARARGLVVFTVDYALDPDNIAWVVRESRARGFVPFVGSRALDGYVAPHREG